MVQMIREAGAIGRTGRQESATDGRSGKGEL